MRFISGLFFIFLVTLMVLYLYVYPASEGFMINDDRCGVNMPSCKDKLRCINVYCKSDVPMYLPEYSDLPVEPKRYPYLS